MQLPLAARFTFSSHVNDDRILTFDTISQTFSEVPRLPTPCGYMSSTGESIIAVNNNTLYQLCPDEPDARWRSIGPGTKYSDGPFASFGTCTLLAGGYDDEDDETINAVQVYDGRSWNKLPATLKQHCSF